MIKAISSIKNIRWSMNLYRENNILIEPIENYEGAIH